MPAAFHCRTGPQGRLIARRLVSVAQQADVVSEPCLDVAGLVKAALEQLSDSRLAFRTLQRDRIVKNDLSISTAVMISL